MQIFVREQRVNKKNRQHHLFITKHTICTARWMALSVDWDCFSSVMIWFSPSGCGSHVVILLPLTICCASPHFVFTPRQKSRYSDGGRAHQHFWTDFNSSSHTPRNSKPFSSVDGHWLPQCTKTSFSPLFSARSCRRVPFWQKWRGVGGFFVPARSSFLPRGGGFRKVVLRPVASQQGWGKQKGGKILLTIMVICGVCPGGRLPY